MADFYDTLRHRSRTVRFLLTDRIRRVVNQPWLHRRIGRLVMGSRGAVVPIREARRILVLKPDHIGDVVLCSGFLRELRRQCPAAKITVALRPATMELLVPTSHADEWLEWPRHWGGQALLPGALRDLLREASRRRRTERPDYVLIPRGCGDWFGTAFFAWWTGAPVICAHGSFCREVAPDRSALVTRIVESPPGVHEVELHRRMLEALGLDAAAIQPEIASTGKDEAEAEAWCRKAGWDRPTVAFGVGAARADRRWPAEHFRALAERWVRMQPGARVVVLGGAEDRATGEALAAADPAVVRNAAGELSLRGSIALLRRCSLYVGNDTGTTHLAAVAGVPVVELSRHPRGESIDSPHAPERFGPVGVWSRILRPAADGRIGDIAVDAVLAAMQSAPGAGDS